MKSFTSLTCTLSLFLLSFTNVMAKTGHDLSKAKIERNLELILKPSTSEENVELSIKNIIETINDLEEEDQDRAILDLTSEIKSVNGKALIEKYKLKGEGAKLYSAELINRLVAMGIEFDRSLDKNNDSHAMRNGLIGGALGLAFSFIGQGKKAFTNVNGSQDDILSIMTVAGFFGLGFYGTLGYDFIRSLFASAGSVDEFKTALKEGTEKLKAMRDMANELE